MVKAVANAFPITIRAAPGTVINMETYLARFFADGGYSGYWFESRDTVNGTRGFWGNVGTSAYFTFKGAKQDKGSFFVAPNELSGLTLTAGAEICPELSFGVQTGSSTFTWFKISLVPSIYQDPTPYRATASEIVKVASLYGNAYRGTYSPDGCHDIASDIAAAAGAPLPWESGAIRNLRENRDGGQWTVVHRGDSNPDPNWQARLKPGDIIRFDYVNPSQAQHTILVLSVSGRTIETVDNATGSRGTIEHHAWAPDANPATVTIYRITNALQLWEGSSGRDTLLGSVANDELRGLGGADSLSGGAGSDLLIGGGSSDHILGGTGNDRLSGGTGRDVMTGGTGADSFIFDSRLSSANADTINDYSVVSDTIRLENSVFTKLKVGKLAPSAFWTGSKAHDPSDRIVYDSSKGELYYDADGTGSSKQVLIASLAANLAMTSKEFLVV